MEALLPGSLLQDRPQYHPDYHDVILIRKIHPGQVPLHPMSPPQESRVPGRGPDPDLEKVGDPDQEGRLLEK